MGSAGAAFFARRAYRAAGVLALCCVQACAFFAALPLTAQTVRKAYQLPDKIYVGDMGTFVFPLDTFFLDTREARVTWDEDAQNAGVSIIDCVIDYSGSALVVRFQAWRAGTIVLPRFMVGSEELSGLRVRVDSVLADGDVSLALLPQKGPLTAPGTFWLLFLSALALIVAVFAALFLFVYGRTVYRTLSYNARIYRPRRHIMRCIKKSKRALERGRLENAAFLTLLCREFRVFIGAVYGLECASFTPDDFRGMDGAGGGDGSRISRFLSEADALRFGGRGLEKEKALGFCGALAREVEHHCAYLLSLERRSLPEQPRTEFA